VGHLRPYVISLGAGLLVGIVYAMLKVRSPAPPVIALTGLLGILIGEQIPLLIKDAWSRQSARSSWQHEQAKSNGSKTAAVSPKDPPAS
jgi:XapX domain-containing protein